MAAAEFRIRGMTGYGNGSAERVGTRVEVEVKGVNHRFLDVKLRLPPELASLEPAARARLQKVVGRGRLDVAVAVSTSRSPAIKVQINREFIAGYLRAAASIKKEFRLRGAIGLDLIVSLPGAVTIQPEPAPADGVLSALFEEALDQAVTGYEMMRLDEGRRLVEALRSHLKAAESAVAGIESRARGLPEAYAARLRERVASLVQERGLDNVRMAQEVALLADRVDLTEELVRLQGYLKQALALLDRPGGPVGKVLDFVMQEMNREANTISSKAESAEICQAAIQIKSEVEKIREQVQNLE